MCVLMCALRTLATIQWSRKREREKKERGGGETHQTKMKAVPGAGGKTLWGGMFMNAA